MYTNNSFNTHSETLRYPESRFVGSKHLYFDRLLNYETATKKRTLDYPTRNHTFKVNSKT